MANYVADFETTTNPKDCRVWAYAICEIGKQENIIIGNTLDDFMQWCMNRKENDLVFFHNLKFDSQFILSWLFKNGYTHTTTPEDRKSQTFSTMINSKGLYYQIEVIFKIATIGVLRTVVCQILKKADRDDIATLVGIAGLLIALTIVIGMISDFFESVRSLFDLF